MVKILTAPRILAVCVGFAPALVGWAQTERPIRLESEDDPYLPAPRGGATPESPGGPFTFGPFRSVQVNVNAQGGNIPGDAANEPSMAIDPTHPQRIVIGWRQFDTVASNFRQAGYGYSSDAGASWTFPGVFTPGVFRSDPVLAANAEGTIYYYSLRNTNPFQCDMFFTSNGGLTWTGPIAARGGDKAWMAIDRTPGMGHGNIYCDWSTINGPENFTRSTDGGFNYLTPLHVSGSCVFGTVAVGPDGSLYAAGIDAPGYPNPNFRITKSTDAQNPMAAPTFVPFVPIDLGGPLRGGIGPNPGGLLGQVWVAVDPRPLPAPAIVYVLCSINPAGTDPLDVMIARSLDGGTTWSAPVRVNDDPLASNAWQWFGTMSVAPNGRVDAIWNDTRNDPNGLISQVYFACSVDAGVTWTHAVPVSLPFDPTVGYPNQNKIGDYYHMISDEVGASLAYAATFNGEQDVYFLRIGTADCNLNRIPDEIEIAAGITPDANGDGVPDGCPVIVDANPPLDNSFVGGSQPYRDVLQTGSMAPLTQGVGGAGTPAEGGVVFSPIRVTFSAPVTLTTADVSLSCTYTGTPAGATPCPTVSGVTAGGAASYDIALSAPIPPGGCATFSFAPLSPSQKVRYESLPGDVNMNGTSTGQDVLALVTAILGGTADVPANHPRYDVNRNGGVTGQDVLRLVQLLNGMDTTQVFNGASLVACP